MRKILLKNSFPIISFSKKEEILNIFCKYFFHITTFLYFRVFRSREEFCIVAKFCGNNFHFLVEIFTPEIIERIPCSKVDFLQNLHLSLFVLLICKDQKHEKNAIMTIIMIYIHTCTVYVLLTQVTCNSCAVVMLSYSQTWI